MIVTGKLVGSTGIVVAPLIAFVLSIANVSLLLIIATAGFTLVSVPITRGGALVWIAVFVCSSAARNAFVFKAAIAFVGMDRGGANSASNWRTNNFTISACGACGAAPWYSRNRCNAANLVAGLCSASTPAFKMAGVYFPSACNALLKY